MSKDEFGFIISSDTDLQDRVRTALDIIRNDGGIDGVHHKQWVLDQVVRALCAEPGEYPDNPRCYLKWRAIHSEDGEYVWDEGIAP